MRQPASSQAVPSYACVQAGRQRPIRMRTGRTRLKLGGAAALSLSVHGAAVALPPFA